MMRASVDGVSCREAHLGGPVAVCLTAVPSISIRRGCEAHIIRERIREGVERIIEYWGVAVHGS
jgi:hypothetical protein